MREVYYYPHFTDEQTGKVSTLPKVTQLVIGGANLQSQAA